MTIRKSGWASGPGWVVKWVIGPWWLRCMASTTAWSTTAFETGNGLPTTTVRISPGDAPYWKYRSAPGRSIMLCVVSPVHPARIAVPQDRGGRDKSQGTQALRHLLYGIDERGNHRRDDTPAFHKINMGEPRPGKGEPNPNMNNN